MNSMLDDWPMKMVKDGIRCTRDRCWGVVMYGESCSLGFLRVEPLAVRTWDHAEPS